MFSSIRMTSNAILKILRVAVFSQDVRDCVLMTTVTGIFQQTGRMAYTTGGCPSPIFVAHREPVRPVVGRGCPTVGIMTLGAVLAE